jgi:hypothetical protein
MMRQDRIAASRVIAHDMWGVEDAIDHSIGRIGSLLANLPEARKKARVSGTVGQDVFASAAATLAMLVRAREQAIEMHARLADLAEQVGVPATAIGSDWKLYPEKPSAALYDVTAEAQAA